MGDSDFVPIALACGHVVEDLAHFQYVPGEGSTIDCPEGCGWQPFVVDPADYTPCGCEHPFNHTCGRVVQIIDLGEIE